jgi:large subunit ribosomal protein L29
MKPQEVRDMSDTELGTREHELVDEIFHLRLRRATSQLPNPMKMRETRRDLARVKTELRARAIRGVAPAAASPAPPKVKAPARARQRAGRPERRATATPRRTATKPTKAKKAKTPASSKGKKSR